MRSYISLLLRVLVVGGVLWLGWLWGHAETGSLRAEAEALERWRARATDGETPESLPAQGDAEEVDLDALTRLAAIGGDVFGLAASARFFCRDGRTLAPMAAIAVHRDSEDFEALSEPDSAPEVTG